MKRLIAIGALAAVLVSAQVAVPSWACACGAPAPQPGYEVDVDRENAIVRWDGEREEIVMQLDMRSDAGETGLVVPTPNPATVSAGDGALFEALETAILPVRVVEQDWWGPGVGLGTAGGAPGDAAPEVLAQVQLGPIEATTLAASDADGLTVWLDDNGYELAPAVTEELGPYIELGWSFVALKLTGELPLDGELDPIRFTFDSDDLVYPMRMSRAAENSQTVRLYVLDDHRATVAWTGDEAFDSDMRTTWAGRPTDPVITELGDYLTVIDLQFADPALQIKGDILIEQADDDTEVIPTYTVTETVELLGMPAGPLLVTFAIMFGIAAVIITIRRRRGV